MKNHLALPLLLTALLGCLGGSTGSPQAHSDLRIPPTPREFRGVWVATVGNIDWPISRSDPPSEQRSQLRAIMERAADLNLNAVVFQVRPACDALYASEIEPWSYYLTGAEGRAPDPLWDPLAFAVDEAHARGLELHAWFNPYRAKRGAYEHSPDHIAITQPDLVYDYGANQQWLDPGRPEVQAHSLSVIADVVRRYDIDAVHFDDYFYPYPVDGQPFPDDATHREHGGGLSLGDWRRENVNTFIQRVGDTIREIKPHVRFGISPFGIWRPGHPEVVRGLDAYATLYADARLWLRRGWIDYLSPQLYWATDAPQQPYEDLLRWWVDQNILNTHIWPGLFTSRVADGSSNWPAGEIVGQVRITQGMVGASGNVHFSERALRENRGSIANALLGGPYQEEALIPATHWIDSESPPAPYVSIAAESDRSVTVAWESREQPWLAVVHLRRDGRWVHDIVPGHLSELRVETDLGSPLAVSVVDRLGNESERAIVDVRSR